VQPLNVEHLAAQGEATCRALFLAEGEREGVVGWASAAEALRLDALLSPSTIPRLDPIAEGIERLPTLFIAAAADAATPALLAKADMAAQKRDNRSASLGPSRSVRSA